MTTLARLSLALLAPLLVLSCAVSPPQTEPMDYRARAETQNGDHVRVSAAVLSPQETEQTFPVALARKHVQPVWIEIENRRDSELVLMLLSIDPHYFAPSEVAWMFRSEQRLGLEALMNLFLDQHIPVVVPPGSTVSGYVYTNLDPGAKAFAVELIGDEEMHVFEFAQLVPGFHADFMEVDFHRLYPAEEIHNLDREGLRTYLEQLPCCVLGSDREALGDPLNLVIVGDARHLLATLVRRGWDLTERVRLETAWRTIASSVFGSRYRTSPLSALYLFGRPQDFALQKARNNVDERNHLRLWLAPVTHEGQNVWVGQISRDIGIKLSAQTLFTHKIDPVVDEARLYVTLDVAASQSLQALGYVKGVGRSDRSAPRFNYTRDPYFTDGLRVVLILGKKRLPLDRIDELPWEDPVRGQGREQGAPE